MHRLYNIFALVLIAVCARSLAAEGTPAPPIWQDGQGPSVYLPTSAPQPPSTATRHDTHYAAGPNATAPIQEPKKIDSAVIPAAAQELTPSVATPKAEPSRRLAPPSTSARPILLEQDATSGEKARRVPSFGLPVQSIYTVASALAIVVGSFLLFAWAIRRNNRNGAKNRGQVPQDAVSVLGRVPLAARQFAELLRVGNKLVLVAATPNGPTALVEISDPTEVDRIVGICKQFEPNSATKAFEQVFQQFSSEPTSGGFLGSEPLPTSFPAAATAAYRSQRSTGRA